MNDTDTSASSNDPTNRRPARARGRLGVAALGAALLGIAACGTDTATDAAPPPSTLPAPSPTSSTVAAPPAPRPTATVDELVDVDGVRVHVRCTGSGETTVLLVAGFETGDENWGEVEPDISARARVCSYARPGTGSSDAAVSTQTFSTQAAQLRAVLATIGEPGPFVVVGHSFGGSEAVTFASRYADQVTGIVLIDASPATWPTELCATADDGSTMAATIGSTCAGWTDPTANGEHLDVYGAFEEVAGITSLGSLPMTVLTAIDRQFADLGVSELARLTAAWNQGQQRWADLSTASRVVPVEQTSHHIELDRPEVIIDAVLRLLP